MARGPPILQPDFTLLATATPKDEALDTFCSQLDIEKINRIEVSREDAVKAGLNKVGVKAVYFRFPDFVIGVDGRKTQDHVALVETKDNGETGRLFAKANTDKVRTNHSRYGSALMVFRDPDGTWQKIAYNPAIRMHMPSGAFSIRDLV